VGAPPPPPPPPRRGGGGGGGGGGLGPVQAVEARSRTDGAGCVSTPIDTASARGSQSSVPYTLEACQAATHAM